MAKLRVLDQTPAALGYTFPAEWEPHAGTWFSWPRPEGIAFPEKCHTVPKDLARIFREGGTLPGSAVGGRPPHPLGVVATGE